MHAASKHTLTICTPDPEESWMFAFRCPHCARELRVPEQYLNVEGRCNHCHGEIRPVLASQAATPPPHLHDIPAIKGGEWIEARSRHLRLCREHYEQACQKFGQPLLHGPWERLLEQAKASDDRQQQRALYLEAILLGCPWPFAYQRLAWLHAREKDYRRAHTLCVTYFEGEHWKTPQWVSATEELLQFFEKLQAKLQHT